ncbi:MAG TPA: hypothetical protein VGP39_27710, partial [Bradyrhizobium sp.]|nr:hypothetical protein [Bradyrhizobium sp.]
MIARMVGIYFGNNPNNPQFTSLGHSAYLNSSFGPAATIPIDTFSGNLAFGVSANQFEAAFGRSFDGSVGDVRLLVDSVRNGTIQSSAGFVDDTATNRFSGAFRTASDKTVVVGSQDGWFASMVSNGEVQRIIRTQFDVSDNQAWSQQTSTVGWKGELERVTRLNDDLSQAFSKYDPQNTHPYNEVDVSKNTTGQVTTAQISLDQAAAAAGTVGQVLGSAIGAALGGNDLAGRAVAGAVAGLIGQKLAQTFAASLAVDASSQVVGNFATVSGFDVAHAGIGAISSFITAELGSALHIGGFGGQLFNAAANGFTISVLEQVTGKIATGATFDAAIGAIDWGGAVTGAVKGAQFN